MHPLLEKLRSRSFLKGLLLIKIATLAIVWLAMSKGFMIGEKALTAADDVAETPEKVAESTTNPDKSGDAAAKKEEKKPRRSFLANLLDLPELDPGSLKKEELARYLEIAERKKQQVEDRLDLLQRREDQLTALELSIDEKLKRMDEERRYLAQTMQKEKDLKSERLDKLVTLYAKMEPKKAAPIIEKLDKDLVVELFKQIPQKQITTVLENMNADKSVALSEYYGRVRSAREYDLLKEMNQSLKKEFEDCRGMPAEVGAGAEATPAPKTSL